MSELNIFGVIASFFCGLSLAVVIHFFFAVVVFEIPNHPLDKAFDFVADLFLMEDVAVSMVVILFAVDLIYGFMVMILSIEDVSMAYFHIYWICIAVYTVVFLPRFILRWLIREVFPARK